MYKLKKIFKVHIYFKAIGFAILGLGIPQVTSTLLTIVTKDLWKNWKTQRKWKEWKQLGKFKKIGIGWYDLLTEKGILVVHVDCIWRLDGQMGRLGNKKETGGAPLEMELEFFSDTEL